MSNNVVGNLIRKKRKELNLTQAKLAEMVDSDPYYISRLETGKKKPGSKFLIALSNALDIPTDFFLGIESNVALHEQVSTIEKKMEKLSVEDKEMVLYIMDILIDRLSTEEE
ncbi:MAG: helix-turn-helix transcriptional regulator [Clostridia bacterium]|nr:helix-turn-helix transcriptional regulator [Clostridia bacterium]